MYQKTDNENCDEMTNLSETEPHLLKNDKKNELNTFIKEKEEIKKYPHNHNYFWNINFAYYFWFLSIFLVVL